jgi:hypothetical protein
MKSPVFLARLRSRLFWLRIAPATMATALGCYGVLAYLVAPSIWKHYERQHGLDGMAMVTRTAQGIPGDPINVGMVGTDGEIVCAMHAAGWFPANPVTLRTSLKIVGSVLLDRPYPNAPVSNLFYLDRREDLAFEHPEGRNAARRNHVRLWRVLERGDEDRPVWLGAVTFDRGVGLSHYTGAVTHHIAANVDAARDTLGDDLNTARKAEAVYHVSGVGPTLNGRNGGGDPYYTDGDVTVSRLARDCATRTDGATEIENPPIAALKNAIWHGVAEALGK